MRAALTAIFAVAAMTLAASPAAAQSAGDKAAVRCILVLTLAAREPQNAAAAQQGIYYFVGRLDGGAMTGKMETLMLNEGKALASEALIRGELTRCGGELTARTAALREMSQRLQAAAQPSK